MWIWFKRAAWTLGVLLGVPVASVLLLYAISDTSLGRWALEGLIGFGSAGEVKVQGLAGEFPRHPRIAHIAIADEKGTWLTLDNVAIDWSPERLLHSEAQVASLFVDHAFVARMPVSKTTTAKSTFRSVVQAMTLRRVDIGRALAGRPISLTLNGSINYVSASDARWNIAAHQLGATGVYTSSGAIVGNVVNARANVREPAGGLLSGTAGLPNLGAISLDASVLGSRAGETLALALDAGSLSARASGQLDLVNRTAKLDVSARAPQMEPRPGMSWSGMVFEGHVLGPFSKPEITGHLAINDLRAQGMSAASLTGDVSGHAGALVVNATATRVVLPGPQPTFLASAPIQLQVQARLDGKAPVATFVIRHPMLSLKGDTALGGHVVGDATLTIARLAPFAAMSGVDVDGAATITTHVDSANGATHTKLDAVVSGRGDTLASRAIGPNARMSVAASISGDTVTLDSATVTSAALNFSAHGTESSKQYGFTWTAAFPNLSVFAASLAGDIKLRGSLNGKPDDFVVAIDASGTAATKGFPRSPIEASMRAMGLPKQPHGQLNVSGRLDSAPLKLSAAFDATAKSPMHILLRSADWRSVRGKGDFVMPWAAKALGGHLALHVGDLADLGVLTGAMMMKGALDAAIAIASEKGHTVAHLHAVGSNAQFGSSRVGGAIIDGTVTDPLSRPVLALGLKASGLAAAGYAGNVNGRITGPIDQIAASGDADLKDPAGNPAHVVARTTVDVARKRAAIAQLGLNYRGDAFRLTAPAHIDFANGVAVDRLQLASGKTSILVAGRVTPTLAATIAVRNATPDLVRPFAPSLNADGIFSVQAKLTGTTAAPGGTVVFTGAGLKLRGQSSVPPANVLARATLKGQAMALNAKIGAGTADVVTVAGQAPMSATGRFNLRVNGGVDLAALDPILNPSGKRMRGRATINGGFQGTLAQPRISGALVLTGGDFQDFIQGFHLQDLAARLEARGDTIAVRQFSGRAGRGTISGSGTVAIWAPGAPVNIAVKMKNAKPLTTDRLTASLNADLKLVGKLRDGLTLAGPVGIGRGDVNIAATFPSSVVVLNVRRSGQPPPPPPLRSQGLTTTAMKLDLTVDAPGGLYVRGRGVDAELQGKITVKGTVAQPYVGGGFELRRGTFDLAGKSMDISRAKVTFDGRSLNGSFDPAIDFLAQNTTGGFTAKLTMTGHASAPLITLSSTPSLPQDEVLSRLLFGENTSQLSPFELAQVAEGLSTLMGNGGGFNPLSSARRSLGLDRLAVGGTESGNGASVEAGKSVSRGVYVGAKQQTSGGTQAMVQVDLTKHLKLQTTLSTGFGAQQSSTTIPTPQTDRGSSVGLSYEFEY
jgi:translocation and assembly module TamB